MAEGLDGAAAWGPWLVRGLALACCLAALALVIAWFAVRIASHMLLEYTRRRLVHTKRANRERDRLGVDSETYFSTCDVLPTNGVNAVVRHAWNFFLEPWLAYEGKELLQGILERSVEDHPMGIERVAIQELTWGIHAPKLSNIALQLLFPERHLKVSFTLDFVSSDLHCLLDLDVRLHPSAACFQLNATANQVAFSANVSFNFHLCNETPGFSDMEVWFEDRPSLDLKILPLGLPIAEIALVSTWLNESLENVIEQSIVGPQRAIVSMQDLYTRNKLHQEKWLLRCVVVSECLRASACIIRTPRWAPTHLYRPPSLHSEPLF